MNPKSNKQKSKNKQFTMIIKKIKKIKSKVDKLKN